MSPGRIALVVQLASTLPLVGLIWIVQVVSYPLFARVAAAEFVAYHAAHARLITLVVAPLMLVELAGAIALVHFGDPTVPRGVAWLAASLAVATWGMTMLVSVPQHDVLAHGFDARAHALLVATNWLRTITWTMRGALLLWLVARALAPSIASSANAAKRSTVSCAPGDPSTPASMARDDRHLLDLRDPRRAGPRC